MSTDTQTPTQTNTDAPKQEPVNTPDPVATAASLGSSTKPQDIGLDKMVSDAEAEFTKSGQLSEDTMKAFEARGVPRRLVETYIQGNQALSERVVNEMYAEVGGKETFERVRQWAASSLSKEDKDAYEQVIRSGNAAAVKLAVRGLYSKFVEKHGSNPKLTGGSKPASGATPFASKAQMIEAIRNPKYAQDPAYRAEVEARIAATQEFMQ